jgi:addiction module HigA family antidote
MRIKQADLANAMGVSKVRINQILNGHAPITPEMALRLAKVTGTAAHDWLALQRDFDLHRAQRRLARELQKLPSLVPKPTGEDSSGTSGSSEL